MKLSAQPRLDSVQPARHANRAFTLAELSVAMAVFSLLVVATLSLQLFGLRAYRIAETKLTATDGARKVLNRVRDEIRSGKLLYVGNGDAGSFQLIQDNSPHIGNALKICPTSDTNVYSYYYLDPNGCSLNRKTNGGSAIEVISRYITNQLVFQAEDFQGNVVTNYINNRVIHLTLEFYQWEYPLATAGAGCMYDYYRLQTRIARRSIE